MSRYKVRPLKPLLLHPRLALEEFRRVWRSSRLYRDEFRWQSLLHQAYDYALATAASVEMRIQMRRDGWSS